VRKPQERAPEDEVKEIEKIENIRSQERDSSPGEGLREIDNSIPGEG